MNSPRPHRVMARKTYYRRDNVVESSRSTAEIGKKLRDILSENFAEIINDLK